MKRVLSHLCIILSLVVVVLVIFNHFNPLMAFLDNTFTHIVLLLLCGCSVSLAVLSLKC